MRRLLPLALFCMAAPAMAAPGLWINKGLVTPLFSDTGPINDPHARDGQWFGHYYGAGDPLPGDSFRPIEFYDNVAPGAGGGFASHLAIYGKVTQITYTDDNITAFRIRARITCDTPPFSLWAGGDNSFEEHLAPMPGSCSGLVNVKLTTEFAIAGLDMLPSEWTSPYGQGAIGQNRSSPCYIVAEDYDDLAWYGRSPESGLAPAGNFFVPTYDFPRIAEGQTAERILSFHTSDTGGFAPLEPQFKDILWSFEAPENDGDLFMNRTTDLKIGDWLDGLCRDTGDPYPAGCSRSGNVSVFRSPEPAAIFLLGLGGLLLRRR